MQNKIKILFLLNDFGLGGGQRAFLNQINYFDRSKFDIWLARVFSEESSAGESFKKLINLENSRLITLGFKRILDPVAWLKAVRFFKKQKFDICYSSVFFPNFLARIGTIFSPQTKVVIREANPADVVKKRREKVLDWLLAHRAAKIIANSEAVKLSLIKAERISPERIVTIYNGVPLPNLLDSSKKKALRKKYKIGNDKFVIINVALFRLIQKGYNYLFRALEDLVYTHSQKDILLLITGGKEFEGEFNYLLDGFKIRKYIRFIGVQENLDDFYRLADLFVLPSLWEGCPNALLEAMSYGLPSVASRVGGVPEIIKHKEDGLIISPKNSKEIVKAVLLLKKDPILAKKLGDNARKKIQDKFSIEKNVKELSGLFINLHRI